MKFISNILKICSQGSSSFLVPVFTKFNKTRGTRHKKLYIDFKKRFPDLQKKYFRNRAGYPQFWLFLGFRRRRKQGKRAGPAGLAGLGWAGWVGPAGLAPSKNQHFHPKPLTNLQKTNILWLATDFRSQYFVKSME